METRDRLVLIVGFRVAPTPAGLLVCSWRPRRVVTILRVRLTTVRLLPVSLSVRRFRPGRRPVAGLRTVARLPAPCTPRVCPLVRPAAPRTLIRTGLATAFARVLPASVVSRPLGSCGSPIARTRWPPGRVAWRLLSAPRFAVKAGGRRPLLPAVAMSLVRGRRTPLERGRCGRGSLTEACTRVRVRSARAPAWAAAFGDRWRMARGPLRLFR